MRAVLTEFAFKTRADEVFSVELDHDVLDTGSSTLSQSFCVVKVVG